MKLKTISFSLFMGVMLIGCANVKPYEREALSESIMEPEEGFNKQTLQDKFYSTQEGSVGGKVGVSGGCGCAK